MKMFKMKISSFLIVFLLTISLAYSAERPPSINMFSGSVTIDDSPAPIGTEIEIYVDGAYITKDILKEVGQYELFVSRGQEGATIEFKILNQSVGNSTRTDGGDRVMDFILFIDRDGDGEGDEDDNLIGNKGADVDHNFEDLELFIDENNTIETNYSGIQKIQLKEGEQLILEFDFDFDSDELNLFNIELKKDESDVGSLLVRGLTLPDGGTKTVYMNRTNLTLNSVCVEDAEIDAIANISTDCNGEDETKVACDGQNSGSYTCTLTDTTYKITGLKHSGIKQISYSRPAPADETDNDNGGSNDNSGGGGGGGGAPPVITSITQKTEETTEEELVIEEESETEEEDLNEEDTIQNDEEGSGLEGITGAVTGAGFFEGWSGWITIGIAVVVFGILGYQFRGPLKKGVKKLNLRRQKGSEEKEKND